MIKLRNPYAAFSDHQCFACSPHNINGLHMEFFEENEYIISLWKPDLTFQGWKNILHGGIQSTLMDEIASWVVMIKLRTTGVTSAMEIKFKRPVVLDENQITLKAKLTKMHKNIALIDVELYDSNNVLATKGQVNYFTFPTDVAIEKFKYPGIDQFYFKPS